MAKYDLTNATPYNEQPLYKQGYADAIDKACEVHCSLCIAYVACKQRGKFYCPEIEKIKKALEL